MLFVVLGLVASGPVDPARLAQTNTAAAIARIEQVDQRLNAVIAIDPTAMEQARALDRRRQARGPAFGIPILIKDNIETSGPLPTTAGSLALIDNVSNRDAPIIANLRAAGMVILGKTNLSEWANIRSSSSSSGWSAVGGQARNPHALDRNPCGSSAGSAIAVAAGYTDAAIGTETDGSITCPASVNGIVGLKPTIGLLSAARIVPISHSQDTAGPMAKDVRTAALVLQAMAGGGARSEKGPPADYVASLRAGALNGARIGVLRFARTRSADTNALFEKSLAVLRAKGAVLVDVTAVPDLEKMGPAELLVLLTELKADLNAYLATTPATVKTRSLADVIAFNKDHADRELALFGQDLFEKAEAGPGLDDAKYKAARVLSLNLAREKGLDAMLGDNKVVALVAPTMPPAWTTNVVNGDHSAGGEAAQLAAVAGYPHLTVPMGSVHGLPVGLSFIGPAWSEARLLGLGFAFEQAAGVQLRATLSASIDSAPDVAPLLAPVIARSQKR
jgi:amidase